MNFRIVIYLLGWLLEFEGAFLMLPCLVGAIYREEDAYCYAVAALLCLSLGFIITRIKPKDKALYAREGFVIVALGWILLSVFGAIPFTMSGEIPFYIDALFETASGFTTTGASILTDVEAMSKAGNFWRTFTHWIGGMGVLVFMMAVVPLVDGRNMYLMKAESPGPTVGKLVPRVKSTAKILYGMYIVLSAIEFVLLLAGKLTVYDALTTTFGTAGTGGFGIYGDSLGSFSPYVQVIVTIFMILFGVNFSFYYVLFVVRRWKDALRMSEVRVYLGIIVTAIVLISVNTREMFSSVGETIRHVAFQVGSIITTTGFSTVDFNQWPEFSKTILIFLMFIGAYAGSTGGGMKVSRFIIWTKTLLKELKVMIHPRNVYKVSVEGRKVEHEVIRSVNVFLVAYVMVYAISLLIISLDGFDFITNFTGVAATINNIGPGLNQVGPMGNFSIFSPMSKLVMVFDMIAGRLELFPMFLLFSPTTWKK
nr:TrkH family potassium uptake protein [Eubacterium sp.]